MKELFSRKGGAAVEFALVLPVLIMIFFGTIELGLLMYNQQVITNASREGARAGIVQITPRFQAYGGDCEQNPPASIQCVVNQYARDHLITFGAQHDPIVEVQGYAPDAGRAENLQVRVSYDYGFLALFNIAAIGGPTRRISAATVMKYE